MTTEKIKELMDACYMAKRVRDMLPKLPDGVTPSYIRFLDTIRKLKEHQETVKISDISDFMQLPRPGVTRTVTEMEKKGYLEKYSSDQDGRITYVDITDAGEVLSDKYDRIYFANLSQYMAGISQQDADCTISTINKLYNFMYERRDHFE